MSDGWDLQLDFGQASNVWAGRSVDAVERAVRETAPVGKGVQGHFRDTIEADTDGAGIVVRSSKIGAYLVEGTAPHEIHGKPWLAFEGNEGMVFLDDRRGKFVHHPGTGPHDFLERAIDAVETPLAQTYGDAVAEQWSAT